VADAVLLVDDAAMKRGPADPRIKLELVLADRVELRGFRHDLRHRAPGMTGGEIVEDAKGDFVHLEQDQLAGRSAHDWPPYAGTARSASAAALPDPSYRTMP
jgi:hypothetical protein